MIGDSHQRGGILRRRGLLFALPALFLLIALPRLIGLDHLLTPDEPIWLARSANFSTAIRHGEFDLTYQYVQPGVTVMWAGTLGYLWKARAYVNHGPTNVATRNGRAERELTAMGLDPRATLIAGQRVMILAISLTLLLTGWYAIRLFGLRPGVIGAGLLATDPFHIGLSRLMHVDGLFSSLLGLSIAAWLGYLFAGRRRSDLVIAGIALGLTGLTRTLAVAIVPVIVISALLERPQDENGYRRSLKTLAAVGGIAAATVFVFWPALWSSPVDTIRTLVRDGLREGGETHERPIFFNGAIYDGVDPGLAFYPLSLIWRMTPAVLIGLIAAVVGAMRRWRNPTRDRGQLRSVAYLACTSLCMLLVLDLSAKKIDRYVIALVPPLALIAGWGFGQLAGWIAGSSPLMSRNLGRVALPLIAVLAIGSNLVAVVSHHPYGITYYNSALGGSAAAKSDMMIGWGEGLDQIGETLDALPEGTGERAITPVWLRSIRQYTAMPVDAIDFATEKAFLTWVSADYFIWYITPDQRGYLPSELQDYFAQLEPIKSVDLHGVRYAAIYDLRSAPIPSIFLESANWEEVVPGIQLVATTLPHVPLLAGDRLTALFYFTGMPEVDAPIELDFTLVGEDGVAIPLGPQSFSAQVGETIWSTRRRLDLPAELPPGRYWLRATFSNGAEETIIDVGTITVGTELFPSDLPDSEPDDENG